LQNPKNTNLFLRAYLFNLQHLCRKLKKHTKYFRKELMLYLPNVMLVGARGLELG
jgi:hypothetical protein